MFPTVTSGRAFSWTYRGLLVDYRLRFEFRHRLTELAAAVSFLLLAMIFFAATAKAVEATGRDDSLSALRDYVQLIDSGAKPARSPDQDSRKAAPKRINRCRVRGVARICGTDWRRPAGVDRGPAEIGRGRQPARFFAWIEWPGAVFCAIERAGNGQRPGRGGDEAKPLPSTPPMSAQRFARPATRTRPNRSAARSWARSARRRKASSIARIVTARARRT